VLIPAFLPGGSALLCLGTTIFSGLPHTSGLVSSSPSCSRWHPATYTSHTNLSSTLMTSTSCDGRRNLIQTGTSRRKHTWVVSSVTSSPPQGRVFRRRWHLVPLQEDLHSMVSDKQPRRYEPPAEPTCRPASGQHIVDLVSQLKRVGRLCAGYRVTCLRQDLARRAYTTGRGSLQSRKCRSPAYGSPSRRGDLVHHRRRARRDIDLFPPLSHHSYLPNSRFRFWNSAHDPHQEMPSFFAIYVL